MENKLFRYVDSSIDLKNLSDQDALTILGGENKALVEHSTLHTFFNNATVICCFFAIGSLAVWGKKLQWLNEHKGANISIDDHMDVLSKERYAAVEHSMKLFNPIINPSEAKAIVRQKLVKREGFTEEVEMVEKKLLAGMHLSENEKEIERTIIKKIALSQAERDDLACWPPESWRTPAFKDSFNKKIDAINQKLHSAINLPVDDKKALLLQEISLTEDELKLKLEIGEEDKANADASKDVKAKTKAWEKFRESLDRKNIFGKTAIIFTALCAGSYIGKENVS